ncbi:fimbrial protein [Enterobacter roggenkampii]|uniref:fimbrial protein n=1 Tax=Enterobacter roggenkampii TaxID=1812935 RepID=UPI0015CD4ABE|nr:fimbrial protein [Enterobacter roggenkampii]QLG86262.1 fimbrial protein [Enterobacter roggenkampii]
MNKYITTLLYLVLLSVLWMFTLEAKASACRLEGVEKVLNITDDITLNPADKGSTGTVLWSKMYTAPNIKYICDESTQTQWHTAYSRNYLSSSVDKVYTTEIPGIGIRMKWPANAGNTWVPGNSGSPVTCSPSCSIDNSTVLVEFVQTGNINQGESEIPAGEMVNVKVKPLLTPEDALRILTINFSAPIKVNTRSCSIYPSSTNVDLGTYSIASFQNTLNYQGDKKDFSITITCPEQAQVGLTFSSLINTKFASMIGLLGVETGEGYAKNFAIMVYEKSSPYVSSALVLGKEYPFQVSSRLTKNYQAQIFVPAEVNRENSLSAGRVVGAIQYTMALR